MKVLNVLILLFLVSASESMTSRDLLDEAAMTVRSQLIGRRFPSIYSFKTGCSHPRIDRVDNITLADSPLVMVNESVVKVQVSLVLTNVHGQCNGWSRFHIAKVNRERLSIYYETISVDLVLTDHRLHGNDTPGPLVARTEIIQHTGYSLRHGPMLRLVIMSFRKLIDDAIENTIRDVYRSKFHSSSLSALD